MNNRMLSVLVFAVLVAAAASFVLYRLISSRITASARPATTRIIVAARNLEIGALVKDGDLSTVEWAAAVPKGSFTNAKEVTGRGVIAPIYQAEPVTDTRLASKGAGAGLAAIIPPGMRAVAVRVNDIVGVAGFVTPGMRVDVLVAGTPPGGSAQNLGTLTKTILQNIEVLSAGQNIQKDAEGKPVSVPVVNLLVTPEQAEILSLASNETRIQLVLRNPLDKEVTRTPGTAVAHLFTAATVPEGPASIKRPVISRPPAVRPVAQQKIAVAETPQRVVVPILVEVLTGSRRTEAKFTEDREQTAPKVVNQ